MRSLLPLFVLPIAHRRAGYCTRGPCPMPPFRSIQLRGGGEVTVQPGPVQRVTIDRGQRRRHALSGGTG